MHTQMKFVALALVLVAASASAQNTLPSSGNVGIGTTSPSSLLSVGSGSPFQVDTTGDLSQTATTSATSTTGYSSPVFTFKGNYWNGSSSAADTFTIQNAVPGGTNPGSQLLFSHTGSPGSSYIPSVVFFNLPIAFNGWETLTMPNNRIGISSAMALQPNSNSNYSVSAVASYNLLQMELAGTGSNTTPYVFAQSNSLAQFSGTGYQTGAVAGSNAFEMAGGSTAYGSISVDQASAALFSSSGNVGTLKLYDAELNTIPSSYTGTVTNLYGLYLSNIAGATNNYAIYSAGGNSYFAGNIGIGTASPAYSLDVAGSIRASGGIYFSAASPATNTGGVTNNIASATSTLQGNFWNGSASAPDSWIWQDVLGSGANPTSTLTLSHSGSTGNAALAINGNVILGSGASITFPANSATGTGPTVQTVAWNGCIPGTVQSGCTSGGDYAESVDVTGDKNNYEPGDVMVVDVDHPGQFLKSSAPYSTVVAGIYSTKPGFVGRRQTSDPKNSTTEIPMAMVGIVPIKVTAENGPIQVGDLLVTSSTLGYAMKGTDRSQMLGAVVGKALNSLDSGAGVIEVLVALQ